MTLRYALMFGFAAMAATVLGEELGALVLVAIVWTGLVLGARLRPSLTGIAARPRSPTRTEVGALAIGLAGAALTYSAVAGLAEFAMTLARLRSAGIETILGPIFVLILMALPVGPLWRWVLTGEASGTPLRPLAAALLGAGPLGAGLGVLWLSAVDPFTQANVSATAGLNAVMMAPLWVMLVAFGLASILPAFRGEPEAAVVFRRTMTAALVAWALVCGGLTLGLDLFGGAFGPTTAVRGGQWSAAYGAATALAWSCALWRIRRLPMDNPYAVPATVAVLMILFPVSLWVSAGVMQSDWTDFVAFVLLPFGLLTDIAVLLAAPALIGLFARRRRPAFAPSAGLS